MYIYTAGDKINDPEIKHRKCMPCLISESVFKLFCENSLDAAR